MHYCIKKQVIVKNKKCRYKANCEFRNTKICVLNR